MKDRPFKLPLIALSRDKDIELALNIKNPRSFNGSKLNNYRVDSKGNPIVDDLMQTILYNTIPIKLKYQMDIYTKTYDEGDEYLRNFLFKIINNPKIVIDIPYNGFDIHHIAYIRVMNTVSDTSDISERLFPGQFTRWTIQMEIQDAFLFSIPYKQNWHFGGYELSVKGVNEAADADQDPITILPANSDTSRD